MNRPKVARTVRRRAARWLSAGLVVGLGLTTAACGKQEAEATGDVAGKRMTLIVPNQPGQGMDTYARMIVPYLKKCLDADRLTVVNKVGAGGVVGTNELWNSKPDGQTIEFTSITAVVLSDLAESEGVQYDPTKFVFLGRAATEPRVLTVGKKSGIKTVEDLKNLKKDFKYPSPGPDQDFFLAAVLSDSLNFPLSYVTGFEGQGDSTLAIENGSATGQIWAYSAAKPLIDSGSQIPLMVMTKERIEELPDVATARELVDDPAALDTFSELNDLHRGFFAPPELSDELTETLRKGVDCALSDEELLKKAQEAQLPISALGGAELQSSLESTYPAMASVLTPILKDALESIK